MEQGNPVRMMFVCTRNSARSQRAEGFARHLGQDRIEARSAGVEPGQLSPFAVAGMREKGIDISRQRPKAFEADFARQMDFVVTVCGNAGERCPVLAAGVRRLHRPLEDPASTVGTVTEILAAHRRTRDEIEAHVRGLLRDLV